MPDFVSGAVESLRVEKATDLMSSRDSISFGSTGLCFVPAATQLVTIPLFSASRHEQGVK